MDNKKIQDIYKLTPLQKGMMYHQLRDNDSSYFIQHVLRCKNGVDEDRLRKSLNILAQKHEILRTKFVYENVKEPVQVVLRNRVPELTVLDLAAVEDKEREFQQIKERDRARSFDLSKDSLSRVILVYGMKNDVRMIFSIHHIIVDGWSLNIIFNDLDRYYKMLEYETMEHIIRKIQRDKEIQGSKSFGDYVRLLQTTNMNEGLQYFKNLLEGYENNSYIAPYGTKKEEEFVVRKKTRALSVELTDKISRFCRENGFSINTCVETVLGIILQDYTRLKDVVFGKVVSGRNIELVNIEQMTGMFINTLPQRVKSSAETNVLELLSAVSEQSIKAMDYEYVDLAEVQRASGVGNSLVRILLTFENYTQEGNGNYFFFEEENIEFTNYDLSIIAYAEEKLTLCLIYKDNVYEDQQISRVLELFEDILNQIVDTPNIKVDQLEKVTQEEQKLILDKFNDTFFEYDKTMTMADMFEQQVNATSDKTAVVFQDEKLTYRELNERANQVAWRLRKMNVAADVFVAILAKRSIEMVVGIYGVLKAGGAYIPIDPTNPTERIEYMLNDSNPAVILTCDCDSHYFTGRPVLDLKDKSLLQENTDNPDRNNTSHDLAYCIYTSGTTGKPKGVLVEHQGIANYRQYFLYVQNVNTSDNILQFATFSFDTSIAEMSMGLLTGATLHVIRRDLIDDVDELTNYIEKNNITIAYLPPLFLNKIKIKGLRTIITAGSEASKDLLYKNQHIDVYTNEYGPTEATVCTTYWKHHKEDVIPGKIPIGKPLYNKKVYILQDNKLCGIGIPGELCIAGDGLARGYLNRDEMTNEKFVKNPFGFGRMYYSGDVAKWLPDGNIEYLGRVDEQIKIRGFRIELLEIEYAIRQIEGIKACAVVTRSDNNGENAIFAYFVAEKTIPVKDIRKELGITLPGYMIPSYIMQIDEIPVTFNGKLDKRALKEIEIVSDREYVEPVTVLEKTLCHIFDEVLGREKTGLNENFFEVGGHSISALLLLNRIRMETKKKISMKDVFLYPTVEDLSKLLSDDNVNDCVEEKMPHAEVKKYYDMSSAQKRMYFLWEKNKESISYNVPQFYKIVGEVNIERLRNAFNALVQRHEILRTRFFMNENGELVQQICNNVESSFEYIDNCEISQNDLISDFLKPYDLTQPSLIRLRVVKRAEGCLLLFDMHHIICDAASFEIFIREFNILYYGGELGSVEYQYKDYSEWMNGRDLSDQKQYWLSIFNDDIPVINLPVSRKRMNIQGDSGKTVSITLSDQMTKALKEYAKDNKVTDYMLFVAVTMVLLHHYSRQDDIVLGIPVSGRTREETKDILGMFVNTLAIRGKVEDTLDFGIFLNQIKSMCVKAYDNQEYPFEELVSDLKLGGDIQANPLFNVMLTFHQQEVGGFSFIGTETERIDSNTSSVKFDMTFHITYTAESGEIGLEYCDDLFDDDTVARILNHYRMILDQILKKRSFRISDIEIVTDSEKNLINSINETDHIWKEQNTVIDLFEKNACDMPDTIALTCGEKVMGYYELNQRANVLAEELRSIGVEKNDFVAIKGYRSVEMIIGMLGILKAGAAYIPIDPASPEQRERHILNDSKPKAVLTCGSNIITDLPVIDVTADTPLSGEERENLVRDTDMDTPVYCIYTSGTTGVPKGVVIQHGALANYISYARANYIGERPVIPLFTNFSFDLTVTSLYLSLCFGGNLVIFDDSESVLDVIRAYSKYSYTFMKLTPEHLNIALKAELDIRMPSLKTMVLGGEALKRDVCLAALSTFGTQIAIHNEYGPTEATVGCADYVFKIEDEAFYVSIGRPISNVQMYVANGVKLCGIGVVGELCVAGTGLAKEYLNQKELTEEKFVKNPFGEGRMYHTGDLSRLTLSGDLEYMGRVDEQIKLRGYRIEPGEVENVIREHVKVKNCFVCARKNRLGEMDLYAYIVSDYDIQIDSLKHILKQHLPVYMMPQYIMQIDDMPMTSNGKIDKEKLPLAEAKIEKERILPRNHAEEAIYNILTEILEMPEISIKDNFFELGIHSIKAILLANRILKETGYRIALKDIFNAPTVGELAMLLQGNRKGKQDFIEKAGEKSFYRMSSLQKSMYLLWQTDRSSLAYNMPEYIFIRGNVDQEKLSDAFKAMLEKHDILRTVFFVTEEGHYVQKVIGVAENGVSYIEDDVSSDDELLKEFVRPFDLERDLLIRMRLVKRKSDSFLLLIDKHHIISDGVSNSLYIQELISLYNGIPLASQKLQYKDYSEWMGRRDLSEQKKFWSDMFSAEIPSLDLPSDYARPAIRSFKGSVVKEKVSADLQRKLKKVSSDFGVSLHMIFLSALMILLGKTSRQRNVVIGIPVNGRRNSDLENVLGMFANTLPIISQPLGEKNFVDYLGEMKEILLKIYENQDYPFEEIVDSVGIKREMNRNPLFDVMLSMEEGSDVSHTFAGTTFEYGGTVNTTSKFDLMVTVLNEGDNLKLGLEYSIDLWKEESAKRMLSHYLVILDEIASFPDRNISEIEMVTAEEKTEILTVFNNTTKEMGAGENIIDLFRQSVKNVPDEIAVVYENKKITYAEFSAMADATALELWEIGVKQGDYVALYSKRSVEMIIAIYGIMIAGGVYVPIDPMYPNERIQYILKDAKPKAIITYQTSVESDLSTLRMEDIRAANSEVKSQCRADSDIYCLYTSGTTGKPKGIVIRNESVVNLCKNLINTIYDRHQVHNVALLASFCFDASVQNIIAPLISGKTLYVVSDEVKMDANKLSEYIQFNNIEGMDGTPIHLSLLESDRYEDFKLKVAIIGGDVINMEINRRLLSNSHLNIYNVYGPTECTVDATCYHCTVNDDINVPIGKPIANTQIYIMDDKKLCGIGVPGELYIGGICVSNGYLNLDTLTEEKFIDNPFGEGKLFKTGDLARWNSDGNIQYIGRIDEQVKINGFRIELGEITSVLLRLPEIKDCSVIVREDMNHEKSLYAYLVSDTELKISEIRKTLGDYLPYYMVPYYMMQLDCIPMTVNGKVDKQKLPEITAKVKDDIRKASTKEEEVLLAVFEEVLKIQEIGVDSDVFEYGINSMKLMQVVVKVTQRGYSVGYASLVRNKRISDMARLMKKIK